jgi:hypothetical protein
VNTGFLRDPIYHDTVGFHYGAHVSVMTMISFYFQEHNVNVFKNLIQIQDFDNSYWSCSVTKLNYSGTAVISRVCSCCD